MKTFSTDSIVSPATESFALKLWNDIVDSATHYSKKI